MSEASPVWLRETGSSAACSRSVWTPLLPNLSPAPPLLLTYASSTTPHGQWPLKKRTAWILNYLVTHWNTVCLDNHFPNNDRFWTVLHNSPWNIQIGWKSAWRAEVFKGIGLNNLGSWNQTQSFFLRVTQVWSEPQSHVILSLPCKPYWAWSDTRTSVLLFSTVFTEQHQQ